MKKKSSLMEKLGFALIIVGFLAMILERVLDNPDLLSLTKNHALIYWLGLAIWALGWSLRRAKAKQT